MPTPSRREPTRLHSGIPSLDNILLGGLPKGHLYLVEGDPGTGKTTLATQFLLEGKRQGERCLYVTLSESKQDLELGAASHGWSLEGISIAEFVPEEAKLESEEFHTVFHPSEVELEATLKKLLAEIERINPERLVIDSLTEFRLLAQDVARFRRQLLALKQFFAGRNATVLLLDERTASGDLQVQSLVHGVFRLDNLLRSYGVNRRQIQIVKMRALGYRQGYHDYTVGADGIEIYPRLVAGEHKDDVAEQQRISSGVPGLDTMFGGGIERGSTTLILGATGVGKSLTVMQYALASAMRGERAAIYTFDEPVKTTRARARTFGINLDREIAKGHLHLEQVDPAELSPGEFINKITREVEERDAKVVCIDSLNGLQHSMTGERDIVLQLHELVVYLAHKNVTTFLVLTQHGILGDIVEPLSISYLADNVLLMRYFEAEAAIRRAVCVLKKRSGPHEEVIRELKIRSEGIHIGEQLVGFKGILSGMPSFQESLKNEESGDGGKR